MPPCASASKRCWPRNSAPAGHVGPELAATVRSSESDRKDEFQESPIQPQPDPQKGSGTCGARPFESRKDEFHESQARDQGLAELVLPTEEAIGTTLGPYKLREKIGEGGCGTVYVADQEKPVRRRVALKVIKLGMDTREVIARFEAERQALAMMDHPNIAKVLDAGTTGDPQSSAGFQPAVSPTSSRQGVESLSASDPINASQAGSPAIQQTGSLRYDSNLRAGRPYFVMELVRGIRITDYCDQANLSTKERLDLFIKVCQAIQHAHQKGIIHRDIKPSNILVTLHDGVPVPKVIDFGIAKATEGRLTDSTVYTQLNQFMGTPAYMSPEQAEMSGLDIDKRSDIYSLGVSLYELLAGSTPFDANELMSQGIDVMRKTIREKEPMRPSTKLSQTLVAADVRRLQSTSLDKPATEEEVRASSRRLLRLKEAIGLLKGDLDWIVMKSLEKDRQRRYDTAPGLAADLKRHLGNEPIVARPLSTAYRFQKLLRRNKVLSAANTDPQRDSIFTKGPSYVLDYATSEIACGSKLGIDATKKTPGEGFKHPSPPLIQMDATLKAKVEKFFSA